MDDERRAKIVKKNNGAEVYINDQNNTTMTPPAQGQQQSFLAEDDTERSNVEEQIEGTAEQQAAPETVMPETARPEAATSETATPETTMPETAEQVQLSSAPLASPLTSAPRSPQMLDFVVVHLFAHQERPFRGYELLQAMLTAGLRYGKKGIFHRHEDMMGRGEVWFNLAQAVEPGTFDLPKMGSFTTPGLSLFMITTDVKNPLHVFDIMLSTAKELQKELGGDIYDDKRRLLTEEKIAWIRSCLQS